MLEKISGTVINLRGNLITIKGEGSKSKLVINELITKIQVNAICGGSITPKYKKIGNRANSLS
mgnify:CR=1 FL=1